MHRTRSGFSRVITASYATLCLLSLSACSKPPEEQLADAREQIAAKDYATAVVTLKNLLQDAPDNIGGRLLLAEVSLAFADPLAAEKELQKAQDLGADANRYKPLFYKVQLALGNNAGVLELLADETGAEGISKLQALQYRGEALLGIGGLLEFEAEETYRQAEQTFREALEIDPKSQDATWGAAASQVLLGESDAALVILTDLTNKSVDYPRGWLLRGQVELRKGEFAAAESSLRNAVRTAQAMPERLSELPALAGLADAELTQGKLDEAEQTVRALGNIAGNAPVARFLRARIAAAREDYELAANELEQLLSVAPDNLSAMLLYGSVQVALGNFTQAEGVLSQVVARAPQNLAARRLLAAAQVQISEPRAAVETITPLLEAEIVDSELTVFASQAMMRSGSTAEAVRLLEDAVEKNPDSVELKLSLAAAYLQAQRPGDAVAIAESVPTEADNFRKDLVLALALAASDRSDEAEKQIDRVMRDFGDNSQALALIGEFYLGRRQFDKAEEVFNRTLNADANNIPARMGLARIAASREDRGTAVAAFEEVLRKSPNNIAALMSLASYAAIDGDLDKSQELLIRASDASESAAMPRLMLAQTYQRKGNQLRAEQYAQEAGRLAESNALIQLGAGNVLLSIGKIRESLPYLTKSTDLASDSADAWFGLARAYLSLGQNADARRALKSALDLAPENLRVLTTMALVELGDGYVDKALVIAARLRNLYPNSATPLNLEADIYMSQDEFNKAAELYREAFAIAPSGVLALRTYQAARAAGRDDAAAALEAWVEENPDDAATLLFLAQHNDRQGGSTRAAALYERVLESDPDNVGALNNLAWIYNQIGDDRAEGLARRAYELRPDIGSVADTLGWILIAKGSVDEGARFIEEASRKSPNSGNIRYHLAYAKNAMGQRLESLDILRTLLSTNDEFDERANALELLRELESQ